ncbi:hypothetical protein ACSVHC_00245 [Arthrobacter sp. KNU-44]|uniref:hypothetical protein n=1 Tax=Arthrobacter sp. KNU-44 TaxID=3450744 RepID=UPI003F440CAE
MGVSTRFGAKTPRFLASAVLVIAVMTSCSMAPTSAPGSPSTGPVIGPSAPTPQAPDAGSGLVTPVHARCDVGNKVLHYLASGDNGGDPQLDVLLSKYVGVSLPQARAVADQQIQQCDANLSKQEAAQASAEASAKAKASQAAAEAQASAQAVQDQAALLATEQKACAAALGGQVRDGGFFADLCVSSSQGSTTDGSHTSCAYAEIPFQPGGTLTSADLASIRSGYPGCFP